MRELTVKLVYSAEAERRELLVTLDPKVIKVQKVRLEQRETRDGEVSEAQPDQLVLQDLKVTSDWMEQKDQQGLQDRQDHVDDLDWKASLELSVLVVLPVVKVQADLEETPDLTVFLGSGDLLDHQDLLDPQVVWETYQTHHSVEKKDLAMVTVTTKTMAMASSITITTTTTSSTTTDTSTSTGTIAAKSRKLSITRRL